MKQFLLLLLSLLCCQAIAGNGSTEKPDLSIQVQLPDLSQVVVTTTPLHSGLYMLQGFGGNIGVSIGDDGVFIIDDQYAPLSDKIRAAIGRLTEQPISFVINTHFHGDHSGGNANLAQTGATIIAHRNTRKHLLDSIQAKNLPSSDSLPVITFGKSITLHWNGHTIQANTTAKAIVCGGYHYRL